MINIQKSKNFLYIDVIINIWKFYVIVCIQNFDWDWVDWKKYVDYYVIQIRIFFCLLKYCMIVYSIIMRFNNYCFYFKWFCVLCLFRIQFVECIEVIYQMKMNVICVVLFMVKQNLNKLIFKKLL